MTRATRRASAIQPAGTADTSPFWWWAIGVGGLAFAVRLWHLSDIRDAPFYALMMGDALSYHLWALQLASGDWIGTGVFYQAPLYPYVLGVLYTLGAQSLTSVRVCQAFLGAFACVLVAMAGKELFGRRQGIAAGAVLALYAPAIFFDGLLQKTVLDGALLGALLLAIGWNRKRPASRVVLLTGVLLGCLALVRENALVWLPLLLAWLWLRTRSLSVVLTFVVGIGLVLIPVATRNRMVGGEFHLTTSQLGPNLYIGNHEGAAGTYTPLRSGHGNAASERADATALAEEALGRALTPGEVSRYWARNALDWMWREPAQWLRLSARKFLLLSNATEVTDTEDLYTYLEWSRPLRISAVLLNFGVLAPLAALGMWMSRARWRDLWLISAMPALYALSVIAFYVLGRYRYPLVPFLALFAGAALGELPSWWQQSGLRARVTAAILACAAAILCNWPLLSKDEMRATTHYNMGLEFQAAGHTEQAIAEYRKTLDLHPEAPTALTNLGRLLAARGDHDEALRLYNRALEIDPNLAAAHTNIGIELAGRGRHADAISHFRRALELDSRDAMSHLNLGTALAQSGRSTEAVDHLTQALRLDPENARAHNALGVVLASAGRLPDAIREFQAALALQPIFPEAEANLEHAKNLAGQHR